MLFGTNPLSGVLLATLGFTEADVPRFRDCYLSEGRIAIHTRTGGGNRDFYESLEGCRDEYPEYFESESPPAGPWNSDLRKSEYFMFDEDDDFDSTYANFYFKFPEDYAAELEAISKNVEPVEPSEKWSALLESLSAQPTP